MQLKMEDRRWLLVSVTAVLLASWLLFTAVPAAHAHVRVEVGPYALVVGWLAEPPVVGERNSITVEISEDEQPVLDAATTLDAELKYGAESFRANLNPTAVPGLYTVDIFPTVRGQYAVRLFGSLGETEIDETIEPEEVFPAANIQFPEPMPDAREVQKEVVALEAQLQSTRTLTYAALVMALIALLLAAVLLFTRRKPDVVSK
ncbi:MAG: hypothetical protein HC804_02005 [Anaerolineae bacterium]|nr:hypothetical protein [Anaerolineae bacterium]